MEEEGVMIILCNFYFKRKSGLEEKVKEIISLKLPDMFMYESYSYINALSKLPPKIKEKLAENKRGYVFRREIIKELNSRSYVNYKQQEKLMN